MRLLSGIVVAAIGVGLVTVAAMAAIKPPLAERFLRSFASSARAHYTEQAVRLIAGAALVDFSPSMGHPGLFRVFGWLILVTAVGLLLIPWRWHHRFADWAIPWAIRHLRFYALASFVLGGLILYGASRAVLS